jgi:hypothetical protein
VFHAFDDAKIFKKRADVGSDPERVERSDEGVSDPQIVKIYFFHFRNLLSLVREIRGKAEDYETFFQEVDVPFDRLGAHSQLRREFVVGNLAADLEREQFQELVNDGGIAHFLEFENVPIESAFGQFHQPGDFVRDIRQFEDFGIHAVQQLRFELLFRVANPVFFGVFPNGYRKEGKYEFPSRQGLVGAVEEVDAGRPRYEQLFGFPVPVGEEFERVPDIRNLLSFVDDDIRCRADTAIGFGKTFARQQGPVVGVVARQKNFVGIRDFLQERFHERGFAYLARTENHDDLSEMVFGGDFLREGSGKHGLVGRCCLLLSI